MRLTAKEMWKLNANRLAGDNDARNKMVVGNLGLAKHFLDRLCDWDDPNYDDLLLEAQEGVREAVDRFDPDKGSISSYAEWWVKNRVRKWSADNSRTVRLPITAIDQARQAQNASLRIQEDLGREATTEEISEETGLDALRIIELLNAYPGAVSLDQLMGSDEDSRTRLEETRDPNASPPRDIAVIRDDFLEATRQLRELRDYLREIFPKEKKREIFLTRFGLFGRGPARKSPEVGKLFGVSNKRVQQICLEVFTHRKRRGLPISSHDEMENALEYVRCCAEVLYGVDGTFPPEFEETLGVH